MKPDTAWVIAAMGIVAGVVIAYTVPPIFTHHTCQQIVHSAHNNTTQILHNITSNITNVTNSTNTTS